MSNKNTYFFCHRDGRLERFEDVTGIDQIYGEYDYITSILVEFDKVLPAADLQVIATWAGNSVPKLEPDRTLLIVVGDERAQVPNGTESAQWVFRTGAPKTAGPFLQSGQRPFSLFLLSSFREFRNMAVRLSRWLKRQAPLLTPKHVECIPIGFVGQIGVQPEEISLRKWDVSFAGSVGRHLKIGEKRFAVCCKSAARLAMLEGLQELSSALPDLKVRSICSDLEPLTKLGKTDYYELLQHTKIALCPRGNFVETFRIFESACLGCVIFTDPLPQAWYFENHPFIEIRDWRRFAPRIQALLKDPRELERLGNLSRKWWEQVASPPAVARKIAGKVQSISL